VFHGIRSIEQVDVDGKRQQIDEKEAMGWPGEYLAFGRGSYFWSVRHCRLPPDANPVMCLR